MAKNTQQFSCKLTSPELQDRRQTVIRQLKETLQTRTELTNGFRYEFLYSDNLFDELVNFVKYERQCCEFFNLTLMVQRELLILEITGEEGIKTFLEAELDF